MMSGDEVYGDEVTSGPASDEPSRFALPDPKPSQAGDALADEAPALRRCIGSERFGIVGHEAPIADFPKQPSQKDGLGRMCTVHWRAYVHGLTVDRATRAGKPVPTARVARKAEPEIEVLEGRIRGPIAAAVKAARPAKAAAKPAQRRGRGKPEPIRTKPTRMARRAKPAIVTNHPEVGAQGDAG